MTARSLLLPACLLTLWAHAQNRLDAVVETKRFHEPGKGELVDVNISVLGSTAVWAMDDRGFVQAKVDALITVDRDGGIVDFRKVQVASPERSDTLQGDFTFQERFLLSPGAYVVTVRLHDANLADTASTFVELPLVVAARSGDATLSDIMFTRKQPDGREVVPFPGSYFPADETRMGIYSEAYGTLDRFGSQGPFLGVAQIEHYEAGGIVGNFRHVQRLTADTVVPMALEFGIGKLPTGNYLLAVELRDRNDSLVQRRTQFFQRNNPIVLDPGSIMDGALGPNFTDAFTDVDTLAEYLLSMRPIADDLERKMIDDQAKNRNPGVMRQVIYAFWYNRAPADPKSAWERYLQAVQYANKHYGCRNMRGFQSDQGYIYLRYGAPNTVVDRRNETGVVPYMIWHYYRSGRYSDRRFVFYQPERSTTCWTLLTSDMPGEINNSRWLDQIVPGASDGGLKREEVMENYNNPR